MKAEAQTTIQWSPKVTLYPAIQLYVKQCRSIILPMDCMGGSNCNELPLCDGKKKSPFNQII